MSEQTSSQTKRPIFALTKVHIRGLQSIKSLDLPENGMSWGGRFPPIAVISGENGSGKTTLLRYIANVAKLMSRAAEYHFDGNEYLHKLLANECRLDFQVEDGNDATFSPRFLLGDEDFVRANLNEHSFGFVTGKKAREFIEGNVRPLFETLYNYQSFHVSGFPRLLYFPSNGRDLIVPDSHYKSPGEAEDSGGAAVLWDRPDRREWHGSTLELFFTARWADLNAKENGRPQDAVRFQRFAAGFRDFTGGKKKLTWTNEGSLVVELADGVRHSVEMLSAGERQAVLLLAELRRSWRPGSLILIDEPELHLHDVWQGQLYEALVSMQRELGGQVILATQSRDFFEMAGLGARALLGRSQR